MNGRPCRNQAARFLILSTMGQHNSSSGKPRALRPRHGWTRIEAASFRPRLEECASAPFIFRASPGLSEDAGLVLRPWTRARLAAELGTVLGPVYSVLAEKAASCSVRLRLKGGAALQLRCEEILRRLPEQVAACARCYLEKARMVSCDTDLDFEALPMWSGGGALVENVMQAVARTAHVLRTMPLFEEAREQSTHLANEELGSLVAMDWARDNSVGPIAVPRDGPLSLRQGGLVAAMPGRGLVPFVAGLHFFLATSSRKFALARLAVPWVVIGRGAGAALRTYVPFVDVGVDLAHGLVHDLARDLPGDAMQSLEELVAGSLDMVFRDLRWRPHDFWHDNRKLAMRLSRGCLGVVLLSSPWSFELSRAWLRLSMRAGVLLEWLGAGVFDGVWACEPWPGCVPGDFAVTAPLAPAPLVALNRRLTMAFGRLLGPRTFGHGYWPVLCDGAAAVTFVADVACIAHRCANLTLALCEGGA